MEVTPIRIPCHFCGEVLVIEKLPATFVLNSSRVFCSQTCKDAHDVKQAQLVPGIKFIPAPGYVFRGRKSK